MQVSTALFHTARLAKQTHAVFALSLCPTLDSPDADPLLAASLPDPTLVKAAPSIWLCYQRSIEA
jgi:hypothetical protein